MIKRYISPILTLSLAATVAMSVSCSTSSKNTQQSIPAGYKVLGNSSFKLLPFKEKTLENGLKIVYVRDNSLPRVSLTALVKTGNVQDPANKDGLNSLTAYLLEQGTQSRNALKIADDLGQMGTSLDVSAGSDMTTIYADSLSKTSEELLALYSDIIMNPSFEAAEITRMKSQMTAALRKKVDNPSNFASDEMDKFLFGAHPYAKDVNGSIETLRGLSKQDVIKHYLTFFRPNNSSLAVVGNFNDAFEAKVEEVFGKWVKRTIPEVKTAAAPSFDKTEVRLIVKKGLEQTQIRIAQIGIERNDPRFLTLRLGNEVLGGSFASKLNQKVRDDLGLTYSIYSYFDARKQPGGFKVSTFTKNETAGVTLDETLKVMSDYSANGASNKELSAGKNQLVGQFPRAIETADRLAYNILALEFYGVPLSYLTDFNKNVNGISLKTSNTAIQETLGTGKFKILVYGDEKIIPQFEKYKPEIIRMK